MATIDQTVGATTGHPSRRGRHTPYLIRKQLTAAAAVATKGSALASADVIQVIDLPADTAILAAGAELTTIDSGTTVPGTVQMDAITFTGAFAMAGAVGYFVGAEQVAVSGVTANTLDLLLGTLVAAGDDWVLDMWALVVDIAAYPAVVHAKGA